jgi:hypothetical protein
VIVCRSSAELAKMREAGRLVGEVLTELAAHVAPGVTTADLDDLADKRIRKAGASPAFKGYHGYPATICASINEEVIHGIPSGRRLLNDGDTTIGFIDYHQRRRGDVLEAIRIARFSDGSICSTSLRSDNVRDPPSRSSHRTADRTGCNHD